MSLIKAGKCLRIAQEMHEITNKKMAQDMGIAPQQVQRWRNTDNMKIQQVLRISKYFDMDISEFLKLGGQHD